MSVTGIVRAVGATAFLSAAAAGAALAAHPVKGETYTGTFGSAGQARFAISFKVAANGKRVSHFVFGSLPVGCQGGGFGSPQPASAPVSKQGTFRASVRLYFAPGHSTTGKLVLTGKFLSHGRERGQISSHFNSKSCDRTDSYSTRT